MPTSFGDAPRLRGVHPAGPNWPANILRFHVIFDRPMDPAGAAAHVWIETPGRRRVVGALVDWPDGLWSPDGRVLTLLFHPARVKRGLAARETLGPVFQPGESYQLVIGPDLADLSGRRLGSETVVPLRALPPETEPLDLSRWRFTPPTPGSLEPYTIHTGRLLDFLSVRAALRIVTEAGTIHPARLDALGETIEAYPVTPWTAAARPSAAPELEDVCGNRADRPFEHVAAWTVSKAPSRDRAKSTRMRQDSPNERSIRHSARPAHRSLRLPCPLRPGRPSPLAPCSVS